MTDANDNYRSCGSELLAFLEGFLGKAPNGGGGTVPPKGTTSVGNSPIFVKDQDGLGMVRFRDGKIIEHWMSFDPLNVSQQLGAAVSITTPS